MKEKTIKNLLIVESPAKAHTISNYLGKDFTVMSSVGHIRSIPTGKDLKKGEKAIDVANDFATIYQVDPEKKKIVSELKKAAKQAEKIWLATDEDREGEAISWHLVEALDLDLKKTNRITFHEITKSAIETAIKNPRQIDMNLVRAQQARQILDRLVGFELSPVVWKKVPGGKSAGRVQSPAVKLLVEREREIAAFENSFSFKISGIFAKNDKNENSARNKAKKSENENPSDNEFSATLNQEFAEEEAAKNFLANVARANFSVAEIEQKSGSRNPLPPFTTSTLQQTANAKLGFSARATMSLAQQLYQSGKITYMRTDSLNLSSQAISQITKFVSEKFGENFVKIRHYKTKSAGAQEAHEAIRPTDVFAEKVSDDQRAQKLYDLIRRRAIASQMAPALTEKTTAKILIQGAENPEIDQKNYFTAKGEIVKFRGFLEVYGASKDEILPELEPGENLTFREISARQIFARPPARYTEGSLVKKLENLGIGRPSTYSTIIGTIQTRGYAEKGMDDGEERDVIALKISHDSAASVAREVLREKSGANKGKLIPTASGTVITDFLNKNFADIDDYEFTAHVEEKLDKIAENKLDKTEMLHEFYAPFHAAIEKSDEIKRSDAAGIRKLGDDPKTGEPVFARVGRFGLMLQMGETEKIGADGKPDKNYKPRFANFPKNARLETITLEQALKMFELPREVGATEDGEKIIANIGRFGPYIKVGATFVSIKPRSPFEISETEARELYAEKLEAERRKNVADFGEVKILRGRFGAYATDGKKNAKLPAEFQDEPEKFSEEQARELLSAAPEKKSRGGRFAKKKTSAQKKTKTAARKSVAKKRVKK